MDRWEGELAGARYLLHDWDAKYAPSFDGILNSAGIPVVKLPPQSPNLNAFAERFAKSIKAEGLEQFVLFGENSLQHYGSAAVALFGLSRPDRNRWSVLRPSR